MLYKHPQPLPLIPAKEDILPTAQRHVVEKKRTIDAIINNVDISDARFETVLFPIANLDNKQSGEKAIISALRYASPDAETQHTAEEAEKLWLELDGYVFGRLDLFKLVKGVKEKNESLDPESAWLLNRTLLRYGQCGHGVLDEAGITNWHARNSEIEDLCAKFNGNVRGYVPTDLCFTDDELDGVPDGDLHGYPLDADGKRRVSLQWNNFETICRYAHSPKTRKSISLAWGQRLSKNVPLFRRAILLRDENARLLGYKSHADYGIPHRMTESAECVEKMITRLTYSLTAEAKANFTRILRKKQELVAREQPTDVVTEDVVLERFDISYYNKFINQQNGVDHEKIMEYFPLQHTFPLILGIYASYWQLRYERIEKTDLIGHVWHEDVSVWSVWDERPASKGEFIGYLYADMVERQNKYRGNQCVNIQPVKKKAQIRAQKRKVAL
ncbi:hypothetical protein QQS21_002729 [Conoideocrella luteorostrata]|uniref:Peptidase M3A/M3B catalytic domain-containing protein n=1 Tax=Conoideocrella luteorostrata TaxID=1105319 RepID=A0AAJ0CXH0_9HYPO|nr:hypothetical protein QQS21_002729 [Conoideocrella luteorostrata]